MKAKNYLTIASIALGLIVLSFVNSANAQTQAGNQVATMHADGTQEIRSTDATGNVSTVVIKKGENLGSKYVEFLRNQQVATHPDGVAVRTATTNGKPVFVHHEAVRTPTGVEEIHLTDATGKVTIIRSLHGEPVQEAYLNYLTKEGIPCACGNTTAAPEVSAPKTATRPTQTQN